MATNPPQRHKTPESFASLQKRNFAAEVLSSYEKLSWYSYQRCESMLQTRLHFENIVCGLEHLEDALVDWRTDYTPHASSSASASASTSLSTKKKSRTGEEGEGGSRKGKDRTSGGAAGSSRGPRKEGR